MLKFAGLCYLVYSSFCNGFFIFTQESIKKEFSHFVEWIQAHPVDVHAEIKSNFRTWFYWKF